MTHIISLITQSTKSFLEFLYNIIVTIKYFGIIDKQKLIIYLNEKIIEGTITHALLLAAEIIDIFFLVEWVSFIRRNNKKKPIFRKKYQTLS